ncbi:response regulator [Dactylosporangium vinaceum]|uniref:histidine kinase n=1 Tax=Dactylosporangium vinaceum TaxID=53362 RepID=A0ABV5M9E0_9ACTN|nr:ATP-binding protein [Dactylosporangium vinaceum]UAB99991.1 response regulator [Dactylosporangium vinaceum]
MTAPWVAVDEYQILFRQAPILMMVLDPDLRIVEATDAYLQATLASRERDIGRPLFEVFPDNPGDPQATGVANLRASLRCVLRDRIPDSMAVQRYDVRTPQAGGDHFETRYWSCRNVPVFGPGGQLAYIVHRAEDVTDFVQQPDPDAGTPAAPALADLLHTELVRRSQELQETNQRLRDADASKSAFLSRASHELRTPMNTVLGFAYLLTVAGLQPPHLDHAEMIIKAGRHLLALLDDILDISRIEAGQLAVAMQAVPAGNIVTEAADLVRPLAQVRDVTLHLLPPTERTTIAADPNRLRQILINLLSNAIKYNRPGGTVTVTLTRHGPLVHLTVTDTGRGITPEGLTKLFDPFERLDAPTAGIEGTGLGLTLSQQLTRAMNGTLTVTSTPGHGSRFTVSLPAATATTGEPNPPAANNTAAPATRAYRDPKQILYVEDVAENRLLVQDVLAHRPSITLTTATLGTAALDQAGRHPPDLVLLDLHLPDIPGEEVIRRLRHDPATHHTPIVVVTADATQHTTGRTLAAGANAYLTKPIDIPLLLNTLDSLLDPETG